MKAAAPLLALVLAPIAVWSCSSDPAVDTTPAGTKGADAATPSTPQGPSGEPGTTTPDGGISSEAGADAGSATHRNSLSVCWTDAKCQRALAVAHGGDWALGGNAYNSNPALMAAYTNGADGVKIDVRVTKDDVPVISHSSPIKIYESLDCANDKIEQMTAAEVTSCHYATASSETFQRLDDVLKMLRGKLVIQLCVKVPADFARTIDEVLAQKAEDFAFIEVDASLLATVLALPNADKVHYVVNVASSLADIDAVLALKSPRVAMIEIDPTVTLNGLVAAKLHPAGVRAFTYDDTKTANQAAFEAHYTAGHDVVSSNFLDATVKARIKTNQTRGVTPP